MGRGASDLIDIKKKWIESAKKRSKNQGNSNSNIKRRDRKRKSNTRRKRRKEEEEEETEGEVRKESYQTRQSQTDVASGQQ